MAFIPRLFPACDLHLLVGTTIPLHLFTSVGGIWDEVSGPTSAFVPDPGSGAAVSFANQALTGVSTGEVYGKFVVTFGATTLTHALHATVHGQLLRLFTAHPAIAMESDRKDRQITVYGEFQTGTVKSTHDLTGHPYLDYAVAGPAGTIVKATGHVETGAATGAATITISQKGVAGGPTATVALTVAPRPARRDILVRRHLGTAPRRVSILLLAEGYTTAEQPAFDRLVREIVHNLVQNTSPYNLLRESLEVFSAFVPSNESGASIGLPLIPTPGQPGWFEPVLVERRRPPGSNDWLLHELVIQLGYPASPPLTIAAARSQLPAGRVLRQDRYDAWVALRQQRYTRPRDTAFGLVIGQRHHAAPTRESFSNLTAAADLLFAREPNQTLSVDDRRVADLSRRGQGPEHAFLDVQDHFVDRLRIAGDNTNYGARWSSAGNDFGLIVYLVNANASNGVRDLGYTMVTNGGGISEYPATESTAVPGWLEVAPVAAVTPDQVKRGMSRGSPREIASVVGHELAHTRQFGFLHDEYAEPGAAFRAPPPPSEHAGIAERTNVQLLASAQAPGSPAILADRLTWNWERVEAAAHVVGLAAVGAAVEIQVEDISRWPTTSVGRHAFLRDADLAARGRQPSADLAIEHIDVATRKLRVAVPAPHTPATVIAAFPAGSRLILPLMGESAPRRLVDPIMISAMLTGPFAASLAGCNENPDQRPTIVPVFQYPRNHSYTLAAYESGATRHCGVIRGAGECVMRNAFARYYNAAGVPVANPRGPTPAEFCFVCKYTIVDKINAALHGALDKEYPR